MTPTRPMPFYRGFQFAGLGALIAGAIAILLFQSHQIRNLKTRHTALQKEIGVLETPTTSRDSLVDAVAAGEASPSSEQAASPIDTDGFFAEIHAAMNAKSEEAAIALIAKHTAALENADIASLKAILARIAEIPDEMELLYLDLITKELAIADPRETLEGLIAADRVLPHAMLRLEEWASRDPSKAIEWFRDPNRGEERIALAQHLIKGLGIHGITTAIDFIASLPAQDQIASLRTLSMERLSEQDRQKIVDVASTFPHIERAVVCGNIGVGMLNHHSFRDTAAFVEVLDLSEAERAQVTRRVALTNLSADADTKAEWLLQHSLPGERGRDLGRLVSAWAEHDFNAAGNYLNSIDPSAPYRSPAVAAFARKIARKEPPTAVDWALTITNEPGRTNTLNLIYRTWSKDNRDAANRYFADKGIPTPATQEDPP